MPLIWDIRLEKETIARMTFKGHSSVSVDRVDATYC